MEKLALGSLEVTILSVPEREELKKIIKGYLEEYVKSNSTLVVAETPDRKYYARDVVGVAQTFEAQAAGMSMAETLRYGDVVGRSLEFMIKRNPTYHELPFLSGQVLMGIGDQMRAWVYENKDTPAAKRDLLKKTSLIYLNTAVRSFMTERSLIKSKENPILNAYITTIDGHQAHARLVEASSRLNFMDNSRAVGINAIGIEKKIVMEPGEVPEGQEPFEEWIIKKSDGAVRGVFTAAQSAARLYRTMLSSQPFPDKESAAKALANYVQTALFFPSLQEEMKMVAYLDAAETVLGRNNAIDETRKILKEIEIREQWRKRTLQ